MTPRVWRAAKCYEGQGPFVLWQVHAGESGKQFLIADATQRSFGVRLAPTRPDDLKTDGAVVGILRKYARTAGIGRIVRHTPTGDIWIPLYSGSETFWVQLAMAAPPEVRFVLADGTALVRKSSQGTYTKRRAVGTPLPPELPEAELEELLMVRHPERSEGPHVTGEALRFAQGDGTASEGPHVTDLPDYQRTARDRLARRVKTLRKSVSKQTAAKKEVSDEARRQADARLLQDNLHLVTPGLSEIEVTEGLDATGAECLRALRLDPDLTPGQNLAAYFERAKKAKRATAALGAESERAASELSSLEEDLARVREAPLSLAEIEHILRRHKLPLEGPQASASGKGEAKALPYRTYTFEQDGKATELLVGRDAAASDAMVKAAKANDFWIHVVGVTGSHVLIPARQLRGEPAPGLVRMAAVLALHHSKIRGDGAGEVYFTRRQNIRKRKGMAPGLWQVDKAETLFFRYDDDELKAVLDRLKL